MKAGIVYKYLLSFVLQKRIFAELATLSSDRCLVLTYHRVLPPEEVTSTVDPGMYVTPATLRVHIRLLKRYFKLVSVRDVEEIFCGKRRPDGEKPLCLLTFDDGWLDFYSHAWPLLREEEVPAIVYLPTGLIGGAGPFWTDRLAAVMESSGMEAVLEQIPEHRQGWKRERSGSFEKELSRAVEILKRYPFHEIDRILECCERAGRPGGTVQGRAFMNWTEIKEIASSGLVTFGSHTVNHAILTNLDGGEVLRELLDSRKKLLEEEVVGDGNLSFCYPNGNYTAEIGRQVAKAGYTSAMTCEAGWNRLGEDDPMILKRIGLHQDVCSTRNLFALRLVRGL